MPYGVPSNERHPSSLGLLVGSPATGNAVGRISDDCLFLSSGMGYPVASIVNLPLVTITPHSFYLPYCKSPGIKVLRVAVEPNVAAAGTSPALTCGVTCPTGSIAWVESGASLVLDGSRPVSDTSSAVHRDFSPTVNHVDVSGLTDGTTYDLKFTVTDTSTTAGISRGLYCVHITEVPLADTDPVTSPTTDTGIDSAWVQATDRNRIVDGTTSLAYGMERVLLGLEQARYQHRRHIVFACYAEDATTALDVTATAAGTALPFVPTSDPTYRVRARNIYGTSVANVYKPRIRYMHSGAGVSTTVRFAVTPRGGATTNYDVTLANSTTWTAATGSLSLPASGTSQECDIKLSAWNSVGAKHCYLSLVSAIENES